MSSEDYLKDISEIKNLMNKSSRFISLSGLAGIFAGFYALIGAGYAYWLVTSSTRGYLILDGKIFKIILIDLLLVLFFSVGTAIYLTTKRAKQNGERIWDATTKRLLVSFLVPLISGGLYIIIILSQGKYGHTGALMLLFYGLALLNASKYTVSNVKYLGYTEIILGLIGAVFPGYDFWFWVIGFGIMHIIYGGIVYVKHERKQ
ncbi:hypothetical protein [Tenacibaculum sp. M341]|uniref:hypothetical protein n=1 Tax=Tenacibaculum sp. M341 TaxID=2530339 RepID=UPI00104388C3|nr:hypothetical protein [Tenacibaculum sp. M341]TCI85296.1 hypothetical protein EYW44_17125 [Tenacibaculum sp. M341]